MTNRIALVFALFLLGLFCIDRFAYDGAALFFLVRKLVDLIEYVAFWR